MYRRILICAGFVAQLFAGCATNVDIDSEHVRFRSASELAFVDGLRGVDPTAKSVLVLPVNGESLLLGEWTDRRNLEKRHRALRVEHSRELEHMLRTSGWTVIRCDESVLRRLRRQHVRIADGDFVSLATHIGSALGADIVVVPRLDFHYDTVPLAGGLDTRNVRWTSMLDWAAIYRFVDVQSDTDMAVRHVDTQEPFSVARWTDRPTTDQVAVRAASAMRATGDGFEASAIAWLALHLMTYGIDVAE